MPPIITNTGIQGTSLAINIEELQNAFRAAFGAELNLAPETVQGQLIGLLALGFTQLDEAIISVASGMNIETSVNQQLDDWGNLLQISRIEGSRSIVEATIAGTGGTIIPAGTRVRTTAGDFFELVSEVTIPGAGNINTQFRSVEEGPVAAEAGTLSEIVDLIPGWDSVTNATAAILGRDFETDLQYRNRYSGLTSKLGRGSNEALQARILDVEGVTRCKVYDNPENNFRTRQNIRFFPQSLLVIVEGGSNQNIAQAIYEGSPATIPVVAPVNTARRFGSYMGISPQWLVVANIPVTVEIDITLQTGFPFNGVIQIQRRVSDWAEGIWRSGIDDFETSGLDIGQTIDTNRLFSPINSVPGHQVTRVALKNADGGDLDNSLDLNQRFTISFEDVVVKVS